MNYNDPRQVLTDFEAGQMLGVSEARISQAKKLGQIPVLRLGARMLIPKQAFERWLALELMLPDAPTPATTKEERIALKVRSVDTDPVCVALDRHAAKTAAAA